MIYSYSWNELPDLAVTGGRVVVVGGGIAGQTSAYRLRQHGFDVTVLESNSSIVGGKMSSERVKGYTFNRGATILPSSYDQLVGLANELGLAGKLGKTDAIISIPRDGKIHRVRGSGLGVVVDVVRTGLLSLGSKLVFGRFVTDLMKMKGFISYDRLAVEIDTENLSDYSRRRLNQELYDYLVGPLARGFYLYEAETLSRLDFFFSALKLMGTSFLTYPAGVDFINQALAKVLNPSMGATVTNVEEKKDGVSVTWNADGTEYSGNFDACVIAITAPLVPKIFPQLTERQKDILSNRIRYGSIIKAAHALKGIPDDPSIVLSVPRRESESLGIITFEHNYSPQSAPPGRGLISTHWMNDWCQPRLDVNQISDAALEAEMVPEVTRFVPWFRELLDFSHITRWPVATLCSYAGMYRYVDEFLASIPATSRVQFCGDYLNVSGTNSSSTSGEKAAKRIFTALRAAPC